MSCRSRPAWGRAGEPAARKGRSRAVWVVPALKLLPPGHWQGPRGCAGMLWKRRERVLMVRGCPQKWPHVDWRAAGTQGGILQTRPQLLLVGRLPHALCTRMLASSGASRLPVKGGRVRFGQFHHCSIMKLLPHSSKMLNLGTSTREPATRKAHEACASGWVPCD